jgi:hypothetical protein
MLQLSSQSLCPWMMLSWMHTFRQMSRQRKRVC